MSFHLAQTNAVLDGFFELLACGKCKKIPERPIRFVICGHMFCDACCTENTSVCIKCNIHVRPNKKQPYHLVAQLISYCQDIKETIAKIDSGDKQTKKAVKVTELDATKVASCIASIINGDKEKDSQSEETPGYRDPTQISPYLEEVDWTTPGYRDPTQMSRSLKENENESDTPGYRQPTQMSGSFKCSNADLETPGYRDPTQIPQRGKQGNATEKASKRLAPNLKALKKRTIDVMNVIGEDGQMDSDIFVPDSVGTEGISISIGDGAHSVIPESIETTDEHQEQDPVSIDDSTKDSTATFRKITEDSPQRRKSFSNENFRMIVAQASKVLISDGKETLSRGLRCVSEDQHLDHHELDDTVAGNSEKNSDKLAMEIEKSNEVDISKTIETQNLVTIETSSEKLVATKTLKMAENNGNAAVKKLQSKSTKNAEEKNVARKATGKKAQVKRGPRNADIAAVPKIMPKNVNKRNPKGESLLHTACVKGQKDYVKALLEAGANPNTKDNASWTPLQEAVTLSHQEICKMLLEAGALPNTPGMDNRTALHNATIYDRLELAILLLRFNANTDVYDKFGKRPIDYVISDEMRALVTDHSNVDKLSESEAASLNSTLDNSILTPNAEVVVLPSNLSNANKKLLTQIATRIKVAVATTFRPGVTHVVVETNERNIAKLDCTVMFAILQGKCILNSQWIAISTDLNDISEIDLEIFQVHGAPNPGTPERSRLNEKRQNPRLFNNCFFYFTIGPRATWSYGQLEFTKQTLTNLVLAGQGETLNRQPDPEDVKDYRLTPFHVAHNHIHPLHRCSHYIIYMPGKDEPRVKYNMPHIKTLPLAWFFECIEKFALVDPSLMGISPEELREGFIVQFPNVPSAINQTQGFAMEAQSFEEASSVKLTATEESRTEVTWTSAITASSDKMPTPNVRLMVSYDMGPSTRGNGYQYDSLNGYGALIGTQSNLVLDYETRNRKCRLCDLGHPVEDHDCRLNFYGSAKAMEPDVAASLATDSEILKAHNVSVGVLIGDNDSSSICAVREKSSHQVIKHSDINHTSKGVKNMLYKIGKDKDPDGELYPDAIKYLHRCFTYAVAQNKGNTDAVKSAILNIPFHAFNIHEKCGKWCKKVCDPENYNHSANFKNEILFEELKRLFTNLSENADKFSAGASSQANESLNSIMARKAPKNICYSRSESADIRYACAVGQKNEGERYIQKAMTNILEMSPGSRCSKFIERCDKVKKRRITRAKAPATKWKRRCLQNERSQLRHKRQEREGRTYESHMGLLDIPAVNDSLSNSIIENDANLFVFFDLETAGLKDTCDILQIACTSGDTKFNKYIKPRHVIPSRVSKIHGITSAEGELYHNGQQVFSQSAGNVLQELSTHLNNFKKPCIFVAHNCSFNAPRLMQLIVNCSLIDKFKLLITGFCDTLPLFRKMFPERKSKGQNTLTTLAKETLANINIEKAHDALYDTFLLQQLVRCHFSVDELARDCKSFRDILQLRQNKQNIANTMQTLEPLDKIISCAMRKRMAICGVNYSLLVSTFRRNEKETIELLQQKKDGKPQLIKTNKMLLKILDFLEKQ